MTRSSKTGTYFRSVDFVVFLAFRRTTEWTDVINQVQVAGNTERTISFTAADSHYRRRDDSVTDRHNSLQLTNISNGKERRAVPLRNI